MKLESLIKNQKIVFSYFEEGNIGLDAFFMSESNLNNQSKLLKADNTASRNIKTK